MRPLRMLLVLLLAAASANGCSSNPEAGGLPAPASSEASLSEAEDVRPSTDAAQERDDSSSEPEASVPEKDADGAVVDVDPEAGTGPLRVLFIGNSYTFVNDLPAMLSQIAASSGVPPTIETDKVVQGGAMLQTHLNNGLAQERIAAETWTHVVLQGQSGEAVAPDNKEFQDAALQLGGMIADAGARTTLFVTWASPPGGPAYEYNYVNIDEMQDRITRGYADVASKLPSSILSCVGEAFRTSLKDNPQIVLHQSDYSHPSIAGTYLAASTFYVALTGNPVPATSSVPEGLSLQEAELLRATALVGTACSQVTLKAAVAWYECGKLSCDPFDFGAAGIPITKTFLVKGLRLGSAGISDGLTLAPPFGWTSGSFPGGTGTAPANDGTPFEFCSNSIDPGQICAVSVTYSGAQSGTGEVTLNLSNAYGGSLTRALSGVPTSRALLTLSEEPTLCGCSDSTCSPATLYAQPGQSAALTLVVTNRGGAPVVAMAEGTPLQAPFFWGAGGSSGSFPGGSGTTQVGGVPFNYCSQPTLGVGERCAITLHFAPTTEGQSDSAITLTYSDEQGAITPAANRKLRGICKDKSDSGLPW